MYLAQNKIRPPRIWTHDPTITNYAGFTVAHIMADKGMFPSIRWYHDNFLRNNFNLTV